MNQSEPNTLADTLGINPAQAMKSAEYYYGRAEMLTELMRSLGDPTDDDDPAMAEAVTDLSRELAMQIDLAEADAEESREREAAERRLVGPSADFFDVMAELTSGLQDHLRLTKPGGPMPTREQRVFAMARDVLISRLEEQKADFEAKDAELNGNR